jgi:hypothetical protein
MYDYVGIVCAGVMLCGLTWLAGRYMGVKVYQRIVRQQRSEIERLSNELRRWTDRDNRGRFVRREPK